MVSGSDGEIGGKPWKHIAPRGGAGFSVNEPLHFVLF